MSDLLTILTHSVNLQTKIWKQGDTILPSVNSKYFDLNVHEFVSRNPVHLLILINKLRVGLFSKYLLPSLGI